MSRICRPLATENIGIRRRGMLELGGFPTYQSGRSRSAVRLRSALIKPRPRVGVVVVSPCRLGRSSRYEGRVVDFDMGIL